MNQFWVDDADLEKPHGELVESRNKKFFRERANAWAEIAANRIVREAKVAGGYDVDPMKWIRDPNFSMRETAKQLREGKLRLSETVTTSMLYALTSLATIASAASAYKMIDVVYRKLCEVVPSKQAEQTYFALQRGDIPAMIGETESAPESRANGVLARIKNYDFGRIWRVSRNAEDDDQTGQLAKLGQQIGEGMAYTEELWALTTLFYAYQTANLRPAYGVAGAGIIPPMCIAGATGATASGGTACTAGDLTIANVENLLQMADYITDLAGNYALIDPNYILVAGSRRINAAKIFGSAVYPGGAATTPGALTGAFAVNPLQGVLTVHHTPFINKVRAGLDATNPPWGIGCSGKGWKFQDRAPLEVVQELENAGESFKSRTRGTRAWRRFGAGIGEGEFFMAGN